MAEERKKLRLAFIGCGSHSSRTLQPNAHLVEEIDMVAMCDLDEAKAKAAAQRWGVPAWYTDINAMLAKEAPDAVVVVGPPGMMQPITKDMLTRGVPVLTEKPPALTAALAQELVDVVDKCGSLGMVATHWRHAPPYARARDLIASEAFGARSHCCGWFYAPGPTRATWGLKDGLTAYLMAQGVHLLDATRSLMGDVSEVRATAFCDGGQFNSCSVSLAFADGATGALSMAAHAPYSTGHRVFGTGGAFVEIENARELRCAMPPFWTGHKAVDYENHSFQTWNCSPAMPGYGGLGYMQELQHFAQSILAHDQPVASIRDGRDAMLVLEAIIESALTGKPLTL